MTSSPTLFILQNIWQLDKDKVSEFFKLGRRLSFEKRKFLIEKAVDYIQAYDPTFSWKLLLAAEAKVIKKEEDRVMPPLQYSLDKAREEGEKKGLHTGRREGRQKGLQTVVLKMLQKSTDIAFISEVTGFSKQQIKKLKK